MRPRALDELKQQIPLLDYLQSQEWRPARALRGGRWLGLCPLHTDHKPSFLVDPHKSLFYCRCERQWSTRRATSFTPSLGARNKSAPRSTARWARS